MRPSPRADSARAHQQMIVLKNVYNGTIKIHIMADFMARCVEVASQSPDHNKHVGCVLVDSNNNIISEACNDLVNGLQCSESRCTRPHKYKWIEHAERNAIYKACREGKSLMNATAYINWWPCVECCRALIQSGITKVVSPQRPDLDHPRWGDDFRLVFQMFDESGMEYVFLEDE